MAELRIAEAAEDEYTASLCFYAARSVRAAEGFQAEFVRALDAIQDHPDRYPLCDDRHRAFLMRRYPFHVIYRQVADRSWLVVAVAHTSRRPHYWRDRLAGP